MSLKKIPLGRIRRHDGLQMRTGGLLAEQVGLYAELREAGRQFPPVRVIEDADEPGWYWLVDGNYRVASAEAVGQDWHEAEVLEVGSFDRAAWLATAVNGDHGVPRDSATLDRAVAVALGLEPGWSDRRIAEHVGCTGKRVAKVRRELGLDPAGPRVGIDGRLRPPRAEPVAGGRPTDDEDKEEDLRLPVTRDLAAAVERTLRADPGLSDEAVALRHGTDPAVVGEIRDILASQDEEENLRKFDGVDDPVEDHCDDPCDGDAGGTDGDAGGPCEDAPLGGDRDGADSAAGPEPFTDMIGLEVPAAQSEVWAGVYRKGDQVLDALSAAAALVESLASMPGGEAYAHALEHRESNSSGPAKVVRLTSPHLQAARLTLKANLPWASVCPECVRAHGRRSQKGCRFCLGRGWLPKSVWDNFPAAQREAAVVFVREGVRP